jgi:hypothetical protein
MADEHANVAQPGDEAGSATEEARGSRRVFLSSLAALACAEGLAAAAAEEKPGKGAPTKRADPTNKLTVSHPQNEDNCTDNKVKCHARFPRFAAYGFTQVDSTNGFPAVLNVVGRLHDSDKDQFQFEGQTLLQPVTSPGSGFWIVQFLLEAGDVSGKKFNLHIVERDKKGNEILHALVNNVVVEVPPKNERTTLTYPANDDTVCKQFAAYGGADANGGAVTATLNPATGFSFTQTSPAPNWVLSCSAPAQTGATFTVTQAGGTSPTSTTATNLTIQGGTSCGN